MVVTTVTPKAKKNLPMIPSMVATGPKTAIVVAAPARTANPTSEVPMEAALKGFSPSS